MDHSTDKGDKDKSAEGLDLSDLQDFNFAANWSEAPAARVGRDRERPPREGGARRERPTDRRPPRAKKFRSEGEEKGPASDRSRPERTDHRPERGPRRDDRPDFALLLRDSPFDIQIFPEEPILATLTKAMRQSLRTYELFEIARLILEKPDRFHVSVRFKEQSDTGRTLFQSVPDGLPFTSEEAAIDHVFRSHLESFFEVEEVEGEPPKGNFQFIARCTLTGDYLSPPNYHRYQSILLHYYQERFADMPFERFRSHVETVKDEEAIGKWLQNMTKQRHYTLRGTAEGEEIAFHSPEEARAHLLQHMRDRVVRPVKAVRFPGKRMEELADPELKRYLQAYAEQQKRFPLDTANTMRGRLRRQHFFIYKKGSRGVSYVCAVKRRFRQPKQVFSETIQPLISFIEQNDQIVASQLPEKFLGITPAAAGEQVPPEVDTKLKRLNLDLRWLLSEGYVTEYSDGRLSAHAAPPARASADSGRGGRGSAQSSARGGDEDAGDESESTGEVVADESSAEQRAEALPEPPHIAAEERKPDEAAASEASREEPARSPAAPSADAAGEDKKANTVSVPLNEEKPPPEVTAEDSDGDTPEEVSSAGSPARQPEKS